MSNAEKLDLLLHRFLSGFFAIPARQPASGAITFAQMRVLWTLDNNGDTATPSEIAERLGITSSTATGLVERLAEGGYIQRSHSTEDRRQVLLRLRPKGRRMMAGFRRLRQSRLQKLMTQLGRGDVDRMTDALETLNEIVTRWKGLK
ncbi:MAG TPA: MarR family transcriptional regulator [Planctomycetota bacterium]|jgi:DNA-binding MarR family transcriptional regulator|nr:MarR family transcriptional regulator [Planctomycetota bacterium]